MEATETWSYPRVVQIGFPLTRKIIAEQIKPQRLSKNAFPILAVTRSNTTPCFIVSDKNSPEKLMLNNRNQKQRHSAAARNRQMSRQAQRSSSRGDSASRTMDTQGPYGSRPRASSLPVWPVTDPKIFRSMSEDTSRTLPKPKLAPNISIYRARHKIPLSSRRNHDEASFKPKRRNHVINSDITVSSKQPTRSSTPMSEYDPDKLNIKQVVRFLGADDGSYSDTMSRSSKDVTVVRPRPFTVAYLNGTATVRGARTEHYGARYHRAPLAARRFMRSAKSSESSERTYPASPFSVSDKYTSPRRDSKTSQKIQKLANLAARYNPKMTGNKAQSSPKCHTPNQQTEITEANPGRHFGQLKYKAATFHSFPTNRVESAPEIIRNGTADDSEKPDCQAFVANSGSGNITKELERNDRETSDVNFNAINAIRLPSVFDNMDGESEAELSLDNGTLPLNLKSLTLSSDSECTDGGATEILPSAGPFQTVITRDTRHARNLSLLWSREKSFHGAKPDKCLETKNKQQPSVNWTSHATHDYSKVIELKLTHAAKSV